MRAIWTQDIASFEGTFVRFGPMRCWPKPVQPGGPPILEGAFSKWTAGWIAEYAEGWIGWDGVPPETTATLCRRSILNGPRRVGHIRQI
jgi:alkanesulfonate monooxygenase SsuD/methylene tetrahydromethanopterin reductase-like flavin-dependent oxidoreductase (luciferase family)